MVSDVSLPPPIRSYLHAFVLRRRRLDVLKSAGWAAAYAIAWLAAICLADRFLHLSRPVRGTLLSIEILGVVLLLAAGLRRAFAGSFDWIDAADQIERCTDRFGQRLQTVTSQCLAQPGVRGSQQMLDWLVADLEQPIAQTDPKRLTASAPVLRAWIVAATVLLAMAGMFAISWLAMPRLLARALVPWASLPPVTTTTLIVTPGDIDIPQDQDLVIHVQSARLGEAPPMISFSPDGQIWQHEAMAAVAQDQFDFDLGGIDRDLQYFVAGGDAVTSHFNVHVLRRPAVVQFRIRYVYPAYIHSPYTAARPLIVTNTDGVLQAPAGSDATVSVVCTEPLASATLAAGNDHIAMTPTIEPAVRQCTLKILRDLPLSLDLLDERQVSGSGPATMAIHAIPDLPPLVRFVEPAHDLTLTPHDLLPITYVATDDYGVTSVALSAQINSSAARQFPAPLRGEPRFYRGTLLLDLASLDLKVGDVMRLRLIARDNGAHEQVGPDERRVLIASRAIDTATQQRIAELRQAASLADALAQSMDAANKALVGARSSAGGTDSHDPDALASVRENLSQAADAAGPLSQALLRATAHADSAAQAVALAKWIDDTQRVADAGEFAANGVDGPQQAAAADALAAAAVRARRVAHNVGLVAAGELAAAIDAERQDAMASATTKPAEGNLSRQIQQRIDQDLHKDAAQLGLDSSSADFASKLAAASAAAARLTAQQTVIDFAHLAQPWANQLPQPEQPPRPESDLPARLAAASQAEAVRPDADAVRARDLDLAARAATALSASPSQPWREDFPLALAALQREHALDRTGQPADSAQSQQVRAQADAARKQLSQWIGDRQGAPPADAESKALQANADQARRDYSAAAKDDPEAQSRLAQAMRLAKQIDELQAEQARLTAATDALGAHPSAELSKDEQALANAAQRLDRQAPTATSADAAKVPASDPHADQERQEALATIQGAMDRLEAMSRQLPAVDRAADEDAAAQEAATAASAALNAMPPDEGAATQATQPANASSAPADRAALEHSLAEAHRNSAAAATQERAADTPVSPDASRSISQSLAPLSPRTDDATETIDRQLTPSLQQLAGAVAASDAGAAHHATAAARSAIGAARGRLAAARDELVQEDPLLAAQSLAHAAAAGLASPHPDARAVAARQHGVSAALSAAWQQQMDSSAAVRLAQVPGLAALLGFKSNIYDFAAAGSAAPPPVETPAAMRQWGALRPREPAGVNISRHQPDPPGYEDAIAAYFLAVNQSNSSGNEK